MDYKKLIIFIIILSSAIITFNSKQFLIFTGKVLNSQLDMCIDWDLKLEQVSDQETYTDQLYSIDINVTDEQDFYPQLNFSDNTTLFDINSTTGLISFTPDSSQIGNHLINISVGNFVCTNPDDTMILNLTIKSSNRAPVINLTNQTNLTEDVPFYLNVSNYSYDPDGNPLKFYDNTPRFVIGEDTGIIYFTPGDNDVGNWTARIYVVDTGLLTDYQDVLFSVKNVNDVPNLSTIGSQTAYINLTFNLTLEAFDPDPNENLTFYSNTSWFLNSSGPIPTTNWWANHTISLLFTNLTQWNGTYSINVSVNDTAGTVDSEVISFTITTYNYPPNITSYYPLEKSLSIRQDHCQYFNITKFDPDGTIPSTKWYIDDNFNGNTNDEYTFCPSSTGAYNITVVITDGNLNDSESWLVTVSAVPPAVSTSPGRISSNVMQLVCEELWVCTDWSSCPVSEVQTRTCQDVHKCGTVKHKPNETKLCKYVPVPSCHDGIQNQGEILPDCGGPCKPCPTCDDGIQNQGETGVDCGGPCPVCKEVKVPEVEKVSFKIKDLVFKLDMYWLFWLAISIIILTSIRFKDLLKLRFIGLTIKKDWLYKLKVYRVNKLITKSYDNLKEGKIDKAKKLYHKAETIYKTLPDKYKLKTIHPGTKFGYKNP